MKKPLVRKILLGLLIVLVLMQFYRIDKTNPPADPNKDFITLEQPPAPLAKLLKDACYDCHSHQTKYPWYTNVMPFSKWIKGHIDHGREKLNFSTWSDYSPNKRDHKLEECVEFVADKKMPLTSYNLAHPEARLSDAQRKELVDWFESKRQTGQ